MITDFTNPAQTIGVLPVSGTSFDKTAPVNGMQFAILFKESGTDEQSSLKAEIKDFVGQATSKLDELRGQDQSVLTAFFELMEHMDSPFGILVAQLEDLRELKAQGSELMGQATRLDTPLENTKDLRESLAEIEGAIASLERQIDLMVQQSTQNAEA